MEMLVLRQKGMGRGLKKKEEQSREEKDKEVEEGRKAFYEIQV